MITADDLAQVPLLAPLPERERASLAAHAADIRIGPGEWLVREGEAPSFFALLEGRLEVLKSVGLHDEPLGVYGPGEYFGEVPLLLSSPALASLRALEPARVARLDGDDFRKLVTECPTLNGQILRTMARRVGNLQQLAVATQAAIVTVVGRRLDLACHDVRDFLSRNRVGFTWLDPDDDGVAADAAAGGVPNGSLPLVILSDGTRLACPTFRALADALGLRTRPAHDAYDVAIIGGGPAGLAAAVYGASEGLRTLLVERVAPGGQAGTSSRIENYLGFPAGISGDDLSGRAQRQAERFGAELLVARTVVSVELDGDANGRALVLDGDERVPVASVVLATGVSWRRLDVPAIDDYVGRGVYYGAARTEAIGLRGRRVHLVGGGNSAGQAAMLFANYAESVTLLARGPSLAASMSQYLIDQLATKSNVSVCTETEVVGVRGDGRLEGLTLAERRPDHAGARDVTDVATDALFVFIGARAETEWLPAPVLRDALGYVCTGRDMLAIAQQAPRGAGPQWPSARDPFLLETSVPGVFAVGDVRHDSVKRVASGVGEGSMAIAFVHQYLAERRAAESPAVIAAPPNAVTGAAARSVS